MAPKPSNPEAAGERRNFLKALVDAGHAQFFLPGDWQCYAGAGEQSAYLTGVELFPEEPGDIFITSDADEPDLLDMRIIVSGCDRNGCGAEVRFPCPQEWDSIAALVFFISKFPTIDQLREWADAVATS